MIGLSMSLQFITEMDLNTDRKLVCGSWFNGSTKIKCLCFWTIYGATRILTIFAVLCFKVCANIWNCDRLRPSFMHSHINLPNIALIRMPFIIKVLSVRIDFFCEHCTFCDRRDEKIIRHKYWIIWKCVNMCECLLSILHFIRQGLVSRLAKCLPLPFMSKKCGKPPSTSLL